MSVCYYHVTHEFQSESTLCSLPECQGTPCSKQAPYLNFKWQQRDSNSNHIVRKRTLNDLAKRACWLRNVIGTHNRLVRKRKFNHLAKLACLAKWLMVCLRTKWLWVQITLLPLKMKQYLYYIHFVPVMTRGKTLANPGFTMYIVRRFFWITTLTNIWRKTCFSKSLNQGFSMKGKVKDPILRTVFHCIIKTTYFEKIFNFPRGKLTFYLNR